MKHLAVPKPKKIKPKKIKPRNKYDYEKEGDIETSNRKFAIKLEVDFEKYSSVNRMSVPDRLLTFKYGLMVFIEYKAAKKYARDKQWKDHCKRRPKNVLVYVVNNVKAGEIIIARLAKIDATLPPIRFHLIKKELVRNASEYATQRSVAPISE